MRTGRTRLRTLTVALLALLSVNPARAETFTVKATILCPAYEKLQNGQMKIDTTFKSSSLTMVPCSGLKVVAMDSDTNPDDYCGSGYTDSKGHVTFVGKCDDHGAAFGGGPDVYLHILAKTKSKLVVGTHGWGFWNYVGAGLEVLVGGSLTAVFTGDGGYGVVKGVAMDFMQSNDPYYWDTPNDVEATEGQTINFGTLTIGNDSPDEDERSRKAGMALYAGTFALNKIKKSGFRPTTPVVTINNPLFGVPTTVWRTINWKSSDDFTKDNPRYANAMPHEMGHATYNRYHSSYAHYYGEVASYMHSHNSCTMIGPGFAWYEGFAEWVSDYAYSAALDLPTDQFPLITKSLYPKGVGCSTKKGFQVEGNVRAALNQMFLGDYTTPGAGFRWSAGVKEHQLVNAKKADGTIGKFITPALSHIFLQVKQAGSSIHGLTKFDTPAGFWEKEYRPYCYSQTSVAPGGVPRYCSSETFKERTIELDTSFNGLQ